MTRFNIWNELAILHVENAISNVADVIVVDDEDRAARKILGGETSVRAIAITMSRDF